MITPPPDRRNRNRSSQGRQSLLNRLFDRAKRPSTLIIGVTTIALGAIAYVGVRILILETLPSWIESQLSNSIDRKVDLGEVKSFSLNNIKFGASSIIPPTPSDRGNVRIEGVDANFNLLPLLFRRTLPLDITLIKPRVYLQQQKDGTWFDYKLKRSEGEPSIYLDTLVRLQDAEITAIPYEKQSSIQISADGSARYNPASSQQIQYDLQTLVSKAQANIKGETIAGTGKTQAKIFVNDLNLANLAPLISNSPIDLNSGKLNANLDVNIPSFDRINSTRIQGLVSLRSLRGEATQLSKPIEGESELRFRQEKVLVKGTQASLGEIVARVGGDVNWEKGYNLNINVLPFDIGNFASTLPNRLPVDLDGFLQAKLQLTGAIKNPLLTGAIASTKPITVAKTQFDRVNTNFSADLNKFVLQSLQLIPTAGGQITAKGSATLGLEKSLQQNQQINLNEIPLAFNFNAQLPTEKLVTPYYSLPAKFNLGAIAARGEVRGTVENPLASLNWESGVGSEGVVMRFPQNVRPPSKESGVDISGGGEVFLANKNIFLRNTRLNVDGGAIDVAGSGNLDTQKWQTSILARSIRLDPFLAEIRSNQLKFNKPITLENSNIKLAGTFDFSNLNALSGIANLDLNVDGGDVAVNSQVDSGRIQASASANQIPIDRFLANLSPPVAIQRGQINVSGQLEQLLAFSTNPNLSTFQGDANARLGVANGLVVATGRFNNNQWQTNLTANNINSGLLLKKYGYNLEDPLNAKLNLSGSIDPFLENKAIARIKANTVAIQLGKQFLNANGNLNVSNLTSKPDISSLDLNIAANSNLTSLPIDRLIASNNQLASQKLKIKGNANFKGNLRGKNLLSAPLEPGNLALNGDLQLRNFAINNAVFEPLLAGRVNFNSGEEIAIDLRGNRDVIAAGAEPCTKEGRGQEAGGRRCLVPYLPTYVTLRQGEGTQNPIVAIGRRRGDIFDLDVENFPLAVLNITPATRLGIQNPVAGDLTAKLNVNLFTLASTGNLNIAQPSVGYIQAKEFRGNFTYDNNSNLAQLTSGALSFQNSLYQFQGGLNVRSGEVTGQLDIPKAYVQDILTTLKVFTIEDATQFLKPRNYAAANAVSVNSVGNENAAIAPLLNLLLKIDRQIKAAAAEKKAGNVPTQLDIQGGYTGGVTLAGTISKPQLDFRVEGNNWQWRPQSSFANIIPPLGLVKEVPQAIPIDRLQVRGNFANNIVRLQTASINLNDAELSVTGNLSPQQQDANFQVKNLSLDRINDFINVPLDATGRINIAGNIQGTFSNPQLQGNLSFVDGSLNSRLLPETIAGNFNYTNSRLQFNTTEPSSIQLAANVPFPSKPGGERFNLDTKLTTEAFILLDALTDGNVSFVGGKGEVTLNANGNLNLAANDKISNLTAKGNAVLENATFRSKTFAEPLTVNAQIALNDRLLDVQQLQGVFAKSKLSASGTLPLLQPIANLSNPLTLAIDKGEINVEGLYEGGIDGRVVVTGAALQPIISGKVNLQDGQASIPSSNSDSNNNASAALLRQTQISNSRSGRNFIVPRLNNFQVSLNDFGLQQQPLYNFRVAGDLTLNGAINKIPNLQAKGRLQLQRADVELLSNEFNLQRGYDSTIVFDPKQGILNPDLDIRLTTDVSELNQVRLPSTENSNEYPDDTARVGRTQTINIVLRIDGQAKELLPNLDADATNFCQIRSNEKPITSKPIYAPQELQRLTNCISANVFNNVSDRQLLQSSALELTSTPYRSESEIISSLGTQFLSLAEQLQNSNQNQLFDFGIAQFVTAPLEKEVFNFTDGVTTYVAKQLGFNYLRVYPTVQGVYEINRNSSVNLTYDYLFNEVQVRYETRF
jgi:translocation and assembly module TamB